MRRINKSIISLLYCGILIFETAAVYADNTETVNGRSSVTLSCTEVGLYCKSEYIGSGLQVGEVTYVPLLTFTEHMLGEECAVVWDQDTETALLSSEALELSVTVGRKYLTANDRCLYLEDGIYNINGTIMVPVRTLARILSLELTWDSSSWAILIDNSGMRILDPGEEFYDGDILFWLSRVIFSEAGTQPLEGQIGVGNVVMNRLEDTEERFGRTIVEVIFQPGQFDVVQNGTIYNEPSDDAVTAAKLCLEGYNTVGDSKWFLNPRIGISTWMQTYKTLECSIADHDFYA